MFWIGLFDKEGYFDQIALPIVFFGFSLAAFFAPLSALAIHGLPDARLLRAAEELTLLRTVAGAFGIALQGVVIFRRAPFHQLNLADHFGGRRFAALDLLSQFSDKLQALGFSADMARSPMGLLIHQEATLLALNDAFLLGAYIFIALAAFVWLARSTIAPSRRHFLHTAAERTLEPAWKRIGTLLDCFSPNEYQAYLVNAGYGST